MHVVIDIDEEIYKDALDGKFNVMAFNEAVRKTSTLLPVGHHELVDIAEVHDRLNEVQYSEDFCCRHDIDNSINLQMAHIAVGSAATIIKADFGGELS